MQVGLHTSAVPSLGVWEEGWSGSSWDPTGMPVYHSGGPPNTLRTWDCWVLKSMDSARTQWLQQN